MNRSLAFGTSLLLACSFATAALADDYTVQILYKGKTQWENYSRYFDVTDLQTGKPIRPTAKENAEDDARKLLNSDDESIEKVRIVRTGNGARERTEAEPNTSSSKPPIQIPAKSDDAKGKDADGAGEKAIIVKVFKEIDGKWVEQTDLRMVSRDYQTASAYFQKAKAQRGYTATWNAPGYPNPLVSMPELRKVDIAPYKSPSSGAELAGTYGYSFDDGDGTGVRNWKLVLSKNGAIQGNLRWGDKSLNVSGIWKFENGRMWVQWQGGDFRGTPKWHESKEYRSGKWKRLGD